MSMYLKKNDVYNACTCMSIYFVVCSAFVTVLLYLIK